MAERTPRASCLSSQGASIAPLVLTRHLLMADEGSGQREDSRVSVTYALTLCLQARLEMLSHQWWARSS